MKNTKNVTKISKESEKERNERLTKERDDAKKIYQSQIEIDNIIKSCDTLTAMLLKNAEEIYDQQWSNQTQDFHLGFVAGVKFGKVMQKLRNNQMSYLL